MFVWLLLEKSCRPDITVMVDGVKRKERKEKKKRKKKKKKERKKQLLKHVAIKNKFFDLFN